MDAMQFEPMSVSRIFDRAFALYRNNFLRFITIVAMIEVPLSLLTIASSHWVNSHMPVVERPAAMGQTSTSQSPARYNSDASVAMFGCLGRVLPFLLQMVGMMLCQAVLIKNVSEIYLGNDISVGQAYRSILPQAVTLILATICTTLVTWLGLLLLVVPGIIFSLWFSLTTSAIVVEGHSAIAGMSRSKALVAGNLGKVFAVGLLAAIIAYLLSFSLGAVAGLLSTFVFQGSARAFSYLIFVATILSRTLAIPIGAAAYILLYYDLRIRKEGFDLQMLSRSVGSDPESGGGFRPLQNG
ncbi:MAG: hypothetical protein ABFE01_11750 [Phycisphaerales bacterium]|jgi:hypothetical protein